GGTGGLAHDGDIGGIPTEGFNVFLHPLQPDLAIIDTAVSVRFIAGKLNKTFKSHAIAQLDLDYSLQGIGGAFGAWIFMRAGFKAAAVDIDHHGMIRTWPGIFRRGDAQCDFVWAHHGGIELALWLKCCWVSRGEARF